MRDLKQTYQTIIFVFLIITLVGCSENLNDTMYAIVKEQYKNDSCEINFNGLIQEPWEQLYIIDEIIIPKEISNALGFNYSGKMVSDGEYRLVITDGKKVLREENFYLSRIVFSDDNNTGIVNISVNDTFCARHITKVSPHFYSLKLNK